MTRTPSTSRSRRTRTTLLAAALALLVVGCGPSPGPSATVSGTTPTPTQTTGTAAVTATSPPAPATSSREDSLLPRLEPWLTRVVDTDHRLRAAAVLVNGDIGSTTLRPSQRAERAVRAVAVEPLYRTLPAGLPDDVERAALGLYANLLSRRDAFARFTEYAGDGPFARTSDEGRDILGCLGNGAAPAARFATDLTAVRTLAARTPDVVPAAASSRAAAEVAVRAAWAAELNGGCDECGGWAPRTFPHLLVRWGHVDGVTAPFDGLVRPATAPADEGIWFDATFTEGHWQVAFNVC